MSYYFSAQILINDEKEYQKYIDKVDEVFEKYNGSYLAVDDHPTVLEGNWNYTRSILIKFDTIEDFESWYHSESYQNILKNRLRGADCDTILIRGLENEIK